MASVIAAGLTSSLTTKQVIDIAFKDPEINHAFRIHRSRRIIPLAGAVRLHQEQPLPIEGFGWWAALRDSNPRRAG
jgi:hypothetical protein